MSLTESKKTYTIQDTWQAYVKKVLADDTECWTRQGKNSMGHFVIYKKSGSKVVEVMNYKRYRKIIENYFTRARKAIIRGEAVNIYGCVGKICARRVERDFRSKHQRQINWPATKKQPLIWDEKLQRDRYKNTIYYTGDSWCRIGWHKTNSITNETTYEFQPSNRSSNTRVKITGFKAEFVIANTTDPLLQYQYLFFPVRAKKFKNDIQVGLDKGSNSKSDPQYQATG